jgi:hypothetical protein
MRPQAPRGGPWPVTAALVAAFAGGCGGGDPTASNPERVFQDGFVSPLEEVVIEAEGGTVVRGYDAWLKLLPIGGNPVPRFEAQYRPVNCAEPRAFFARVLGGDRVASPEAELICRFYQDPRLDFDNGRWVVESPIDGRLYFRAWKRY